MQDQFQINDPAKLAQNNPPHNLLHAQIEPTSQLLALPAPQLNDYKDNVQDLEMIQEMKERSKDESSEQSIVAQMQ